MKKLLLAAIVSAIAFVSGPAARAQTSACSPLAYGNVLTPAQWNACLNSKQTALGYTPLNVAGGVMTGRLVTAATSSVQAGFNLPPGTPPGTPKDGDLWTTTSGLFVRVNGSTVGPLASSTTAGLTIGTSTVTGGTNGNVLSISGGAVGQLSPTITINTVSCSLGGSCSITATAASITVGSTGIVSGSGGVLYDNGGTLGSKAVSGTGNLAAVTSPSFTTPNIGAATGTTLSLSGANLSLAGVNANLELGSTALSGATFIDFHSSGNVNDYDSRITVTGGGVSAGQGLMQIYGLGLQVNGGLSTTSGLSLFGSTSGTTSLAAAAVAGGTISVPTVSGTKTMALLDQASQVVSGGATVTPLILSSASQTINCGLRPLQYLPAPTSAYTITAPATDSSCLVMVQNNAAGSPVPTMSGFFVGSSALSQWTTGASQAFYVSIWRINGAPGFSVIPAQ